MATNKKKAAGLLACVLMASLAAGPAVAWAQGVSCAGEENISDPHPASMVGAAGEKRSAPQGVAGARREGAVSRRANPTYAWRYERGQWVYYNSVGTRFAPEQQKAHGFDGRKGVVSTGIDVSEHNGSIDWDKVKNSYVDFAFVRLADASITSKRVDYQYANNMSACNARNIPVGIYFYSRALTPEQARAEARLTLKYAKKYRIQLPIVMDVEEDMYAAQAIGRSSCQQNLSPSALTALTNAFCDEIAKAGYVPMLYTSRSWYNYEFLPNLLHNNIRLWIAEWGAEPVGIRQRDVWQCTASGRTPGINGDVDINFAYVKSYESTVSLYRDKQGNLRYKNSDGSLASNCWKQVGGNWYYFGSDAIGKTGMATITYRGKHVKFYFNRQGVMETGWIWLSGSWYYADKSSGALVNGWKKNLDQWYYFDAKKGGAMVTGPKTIAGVNYQFNKDGVMQTGWIWHSGSWYYADKSSGALASGWSYIIDNWYYFDAAHDGVMVTGLKKIRGVSYLFLNSGEMAMGTHFHDGKAYFCDDTGAARLLSKGFHDIEGKLYHVNSQGGLTGPGWRKIDSRWYYFNQDKSVKLGWILSEGLWYYADRMGRSPERGAMVTGWRDIQGSWYYFNPTGDAASDWKYLSGHWYKFNGDCQVITGWFKYQNSWCYGQKIGEVGEIGRLYVGKHWIAGIQYNFNSDGILVS